MARDHMRVLIKPRTMAIITVAYVGFFLSILSATTLLLNEAVVNAKPVQILMDPITNAVYYLAAFEAAAAVNVYYLWWGIAHELVDNLRRGMRIMSVLVYFTGVTVAYISVKFYFKSKEATTNEMQSAVMNYYYDETATSGMDEIQTTLECCGIWSFADWNSNDHFRCSFSNLNLQRCNVPSSCCKPTMIGEVDLQCSIGALYNAGDIQNHSEDIHVEGCLESAFAHLHDSGFFIVAYGAFVFVIEMLTIGCAKAILTAMEFELLRLVLSRSGLERQEGSQSGDNRIKEE